MNRARLRSTLLLAGLPVLSATAMWGVMTMIDKPEEQRSERLVPSVVTEEIRELELESAVVARGEVAALNATAVSLSGDVGGLEGEPLYTGRLAAVGSQVPSGSVLVEISGRPVIALQGTVPMYRDLSVGTSGEDVRQFEQALAALGHFSGIPDSTFDSRTGAAVQSLYRTFGYEAVQEEPVAEAPDSFENEGDNEARQPSAPGPVHVPRGEIIFIKDLPRRVGSVTAVVGQAPGGEAFTLKGTRVVVLAKVPKEQANILETGARATFSDTVSGLETRGRVKKVGKQTDAAGNVTVRLTARDDLHDFVGTNLRVRIPVRTTEGEVLAVSPAAVYTTESGETFVDVVRDATPGSEILEDVKVRLGLAADSLVEVEPVDGTLRPGDRVVTAAQ